jgi:hypothetical protein
VGLSARPSHAKARRQVVLGVASVVALTACSYNVTFEDCQVTCRTSTDCPGDLMCLEDLCRVPGIAGACVAPGAETLRQAGDDRVASNIVIGCTNPDDTTADGSWYRLFSLAAEGITTSFQVERVTLGICVAIGTPEVQLKLALYAGGATDTILDLSKVTPLTSQTVAIPPTQITELVDVPISATVPAGSLLLVEVEIADLEGTGLEVNMGFTAAAETQPAYVRSPLCGPAVPTKTTFAMQPTAHLVLTVTGTP